MVSVLTSQKAWYASRTDLSAGDFAFARSRSRNFASVGTPVVAIPPSGGVAGGPSSEEVGDADGFAVEASPEPCGLSELPEQPVTTTAARIVASVRARHVVLIAPLVADW